MQIEFARALTEAAEGEGIDMTVRDDYSGRGMHGETTTAIECGSWRDFSAAAMRAAWDARMVQGNDWIYFFLQEVREARSDSMGRDNIVIY